MTLRNNKCVCVKILRDRIFFVTEDSEESESSTDMDSSLNDVVDGRTSPVSVDETDMDTLPDASVDKNVVRTKVFFIKYIYIY